MRTRRWSPASPARSSSSCREATRRRKEEPCAATSPTPAPRGGLALRELPEPEPSPHDAVAGVGADGLNRGELALLQQRTDGWRPGQDVAGRSGPARPTSARIRWRSRASRAGRRFHERVPAAQPQHERSRRASRDRPGLPGTAAADHPVPVRGDRRRGRPRGSSGMTGTGRGRAGRGNLQADGKCLVGFANDTTWCRLARGDAARPARPAGPPFDRVSHAGSG